MLAATLCVLINLVALAIYYFGYERLPMKSAGLLGL